MSGSAPNLLRHLARHLILEKGFAVAEDPSSDGTLAPLGRLSLPDLPPARCFFPELTELRGLFDAILVRADGLQFIVVPLQRISPDSLREGDAPRLRDTLLRIGEKCLHYTGSVGSSKMPVWFRILIIFQGGLDEPAWRQLESVRKRSPYGPKVMIDLLGFDVPAGEARSTLAIPGRWFAAAYARRLLREASMPDEEVLALVARAGVRWVPILASATVGALVAIFTRIGLVRLGIVRGGWLSAADVMIGLFVALVAIFARRVRARSAQQGVLASLTYGLLLCAILLAHGAQPTLALAGILGVIVFNGALFGAVWEKA